MKKFYVYLFINLLAISHPYYACEASSQQRRERIASRRKRQKRRYENRQSGKSVTEIVAVGCVIVILSICLNNILKRKRRVEFFVQMAEKGIDKVNEDIKRHIPKLNKRRTLQYLRRKHYTMVKFKLKKRKKFILAFSKHFKNKKLRGPAAKLHKELQVRIDDKVRQGRLSVP